MEDWDLKHVVTQASGDPSVAPAGGRNTGSRKETAARSTIGMAGMRWVDHWVGLPLCFLLGLFVSAARRMGFRRSRSIAGNRVLAVFKETEVSIAKGLSGGLSLSNRLPCAVKGMEKGPLLCRVDLDHKGSGLGSVITTRAGERLGLQPGDSVQALVKANEVQLMEPR